MTMKTTSNGDDGESGPSGYTPLDDLGGGAASSHAYCVANDVNNDKEGENTDEQEEMQQSTFILASHLPPTEEPEGWSDYSDNDNDADATNGTRANGSLNAEEGAFFADMTTFGPHGTTSTGDNDNGDDDENNGRDDAIMAEGYAPLSTSGGGEGSEDDDNDNDEIDFRAIADQALRALDDEYLSTVGQADRNDGETKLVQDVAPSIMQDDTDTDGNEELKQRDGASVKQDEKVSEESRDNNSNEASDQLPPQQAITQLPSKELPPIDGDAVRRAMASMRLKSPDLTTNLDAGAERRLDPKYRLSLAPALVPPTHAIIPSAPLAAFRRTSPSAKAVAATANLSRSAIISEALVRCLPHLLLPTSTGTAGAKAEKTTLTIHIVGSDHVECQTDDTVRTAVGPLMRWIGAACSSQLSSVDMELLGPNVPLAAEKRGAMDLLPSDTAGSNSGIQCAKARCINCLYHDHLRGKGKTPDLVVAFNAGIWGYDEWRPTLEALCEQETSIPTVITGYTVQEAEDDAEVISEIVGASPTQDFAEMAGKKDIITTSIGSRGRCLWEAEINPYGSRKKRETSTAINGREYRENGAWQAWLLGGK